MKAPLFLRHPALRILTFLLAGACAARADVSARLSPESLSLGESARLAVTVSGEPYTEPVIPAVPGLRFSSGGVQRSMSMINGVVDSKVTRFFLVTPERAGDFTIPAISAGSLGSSQPLSLKVAAAGNKPPPPANNGRPSQNPGQAQENGPLSSEARDKLAFLRVVLPKKELTVGELVPVSIKAYFRAGLSITRSGLPTLSSDAFTLNKLPDRPTQAQTSIGGQPFIVVTWTSSISAVKAGEYSFSLTMPLSARIRERGARRDPIRDAFGEDLPEGFDDPFFNQFFGRSVEKDLTMNSGGETVTIHEVPTEGRPADFSGAVGDFEISATATPVSGAAGDPLTLKLTVNGTGNFNRVATEGLPAGGNWKTYPPSADFLANDSGETSGVKTFTQAIVPLKAGPQEIPAVNFSFFDPDKKEFVSKTTAPIPVNIQPGAASAAAALPAASASAAPPEAPKPDADGLMPDRALPAAPDSALRPLAPQPWFLALNSALLAALGIGWAARRVRARLGQTRELPPREAAEKAVSESLGLMDAALQAKDAPRFFEAARRAVQERLAFQWSIPAARVTLPEIRARLNGQGGELRALFETADEIAYSGRRFTSPDLHQWRELVKAQLQLLSGKGGTASAPGAS